MNILKNKDILIVIALIIIPAMFLWRFDIFPAFAYVIACLVALIPAVIAANKGCNLVLWFIYALFLWLIAFIHSLLLKDNDGSLRQRGYRKCPYCAEYIRPEAKICRYCGHSLS
ncbi:zinc ribbon domain-containing protein [uncultured Megasphaera sp.]|uniref:zinc ribbon domain-containing protein n=1 Tax=uncultured Megasphaera sp. TaxID=165188 RepID=UPI0025DCEA51|nr:zinc-ribbon domain-containing protein [uncultured Megasphaera sp.]